MNKIKITRNRQFYGAHAKCWIVCGLSKDEAKNIIIKFRKKPQFLPANIIPIINGQTIYIETNDEMSAIYATMMIPIFSKQVNFSNIISANGICSNESYLLTLLENTAYNRNAGNILELTKL